MTFDPTSWPSGSGGASIGPSCALDRGAALDIRTVGDHPILWDALYDNAWDFNPLGAIPAGLGLTFVFNGTDGTVTTTAAGVWAFHYNLLRASDATWQGAFSNGLGGFTLTALPSLAYGLTIALPAGAALVQAVSVTNIAAATPYTLSAATLAITRLA